MKIGKIHNYKNGEPYILKANTVKAHICCDCHLIHTVFVDSAKKGKCVMYWYRDEHETRQLRKKKKERME